MTFLQTIQDNEYSKKILTTRNPILIIFVSESLGRLF